MMTPQVVRTALVDAASVASLMATTEATIVEAPRKGGDREGELAILFWAVCPQIFIRILTILRIQLTLAPWPEEWAAWAVWVAWVAWVACLV